MTVHHYLNHEGRVSAWDIYFRMRRAREFIDQCYDRPIDLDQIAKEAYFSPYHFLRLFRSAFNKTPHEYLIHRRIERAKQLLIATDLSVTQVCLEVGFQSLGSFSSLFQRCVGAPPTAYRARMFKRRHFLVRYPQMAIPACFQVKFGRFAPPPN